jgi:hypothetical protein
MPKMAQWAMFAGVVVMGEVSDVGCGVVGKPLPQIVELAQQTG